MITIDFTSVSALLAGICGLFFLIQIIYIGGVYSKLHTYFRRPKEAEPVDLPPVSVILVTKDAGEALNENLPAILEQDYPEFEVIVINDKSAGEDEFILKRLASRYTNLYHTFIPETARYVSRKKLGIAMGIRASRYEWIVVTGPFCRPVSSDWLKCLAREMTPETDIVLGYSNYFPKKGWFARRISVDSFFRSLRYLCMALAGHPYIFLAEFSLRSVVRTEFQPRSYSANGPSESFEMCRPAVGRILLGRPCLHRHLLSEPVFGHVPDDRVCNPCHGAHPVFPVLCSGLLSIERSHGCCSSKYRYQEVSSLCHVFFYLRNLSIVKSLPEKAFTEVHGSLPDVQKLSSAGRPRGTNTSEVR